METVPSWGRGRYPKVKQTWILCLSGGDVEGEIPKVKTNMGIVPSWGRWEGGDTTI